jgi:hypothetical protein
MNRYIAELAATHPIAAEAVNELSDLASQGKFFVLSATTDSEKLERVFTNGTGYWLGQIGLFNANPDLNAEPEIAAITFITQPDAKSKLTFLKLFQEHVVPWQWALEELRIEEEATPATTGFRAAHAAFQENSMLEAAARLAADGQRLLGGFAVVATTTTPQEYIGQIYTSREFAEQYQFYFREAVLQAAELRGIDEDEKRKMTTLTSTQSVNDVIRTQILQRLPYEDDVTEVLFPEGLPSEKTMTDKLNEASRSTEQKQSAPPQYRKNNSDDKKKRRNASQARKANRKRK